MTDPVVSILIPLAEPPYLENALNSALAQTVESLEVVVAANPRIFKDDVKNDILKKGDSIRVCVPEEDVSAGALLQMAAGAARGQYITWLRADQVFDPRKTDLQIAALNQFAGPAVVSCGIRCISTRADSNNLMDRDDNTLVVDGQTHLSTLTSVLDGTRSPRTLLTHRSCVEAAGGFDPAFGIMPEVDLAARLAERFPFVHVPMNLVRWHCGSISPDSLARQKEEERIWSRILQDDTRSLACLGELNRAALSLNAAVVLPTLKDRVASRIGLQDLTIGIVPAANGSTKIDPGQSKADVGVPGARCIVLQSRQDPMSLLIEAFAQNTSDWLVLIDATAPTEAGVLTHQILYSAAGKLDACLPVRDGLVFESSASGSLIYGTLFRHSVLANSLEGFAGSESTFWSVFARNGRIGALPSAGHISRPSENKSATQSALTTLELGSALVDPEWYYRMHPDVAQAGVDPVEHYLRYGWRERRDPNPWFCTAWYIDQFPELNQSETSPLEHFVRTGGPANMWSRRGFDLRWTIRNNMGGKPRTFEALLSFFFPGLRKAASRKLPDPDRLWEHVELAMPQVISMIRALRSDSLSLHDTLVDLIDPDWYLQANPDVAAAKVNPVEHYLHYGWREGRDPNAWFSTSWYLEQNPDTNHVHESALEHFIKQGAKSGAQPHPGFDLRWYASRYLPGEPLSSEVLRHFLKKGAENGAVPDPRLDRDDVHRQLKALEPSQRPAKIRELQAQQLNEYESVARIIDIAWYRAMNPDVAASGVDPVTHYLTCGWREKRDPSPWFNTSWYLARNPRAAESNVSPLHHYVRTGAAAGLRPSPLFDTIWYARQYLSGAPSIEALLHFLSSGITSGTVPDPILFREDILDKVAGCPVEERPDLLRRLVGSPGTELEFAL